MDNITTDNNSSSSSNSNPIDLLTKVALDFEQQNKTIEYSLDPFERLKQLQEVEQRSRVIRATQAYRSLKVYIADSDKNWKLKATEERKKRVAEEPLENALYENNVLKGKLERREQLIKSMRKYINTDILGLLLDAENDIENKKQTNTTTTNSIMPPTYTTSTNSNMLVTRNVSDHSRDIIKKKVSYDNHLDDMSLLSLQDELISLKKTIQLKDSDIDLLKKRLEKEHNNKKDLLSNAERHELRILDEVKEIQAERNKLNLIITQKDNAFEKLLKSNETISNDLLEAKQNLNIRERELVERNEELENVKLNLRKVREERDTISNLLPDLNSKLDDNQKQIHTLEDSNILLSQRYDRLVLELDKLVADGLYLPNKKEQANELRKQSMVTSKRARVSPSVKGLLQRKTKDASSDEEEKRSVSGKGARPSSLNSPTANTNNNDDIDGTKRVSFFERKKAEEELQQEKLKLNASMRINAALEHKMQEMKKKMDEQMVNISIREEDMKSRENDTRNTIMDLKQQKEETESKVRALRMELQSIKNIKKEKPNTAVKSIQTLIKGNTIYDLPDDTINDQASGSKGVSGAWKSLVKAELAIYKPGADPITDTTVSIDATSVDDNSITQTPKNAKKGKKKKKTRKSLVKSKNRVTMLNARSTSSNDYNDNDYDNEENDDGDDGDDEDDDDEDDDDYETVTKKAHRKSKLRASFLHVETQTDSNDTITHTNSDTNNGAKINKRPTAKQDFSLLLSSLKPLISQITSTSNTFLKDHGISDIDLHSTSHDSTALAADYINMINNANSNTTPKWTTKLQLHPSDLYEIMDYIISIINTRNSYISGNTNHSMLLSVLDPILESLLYLLTRRLTKYNYNGYKDYQYIEDNVESDDMYENIEDDDHTNNNTFKYTSVKKVAHFDNDSINNTTINYHGRHYLNMSDVQRKLPSNVDFLLQYAQAELQKRMETESIELKENTRECDDSASTAPNTNITIENERNQNINNPIFTRLAGAHWALSGDLQEIRTKWENMKIKHSSSGSPIVIEDSLRSKVTHNKTNAPPSSPPNSAKQRIRRGRTISSSGTRGGGSLSPPARSASPYKDDSAVVENVLDGLEAYGVSLESNVNSVPANAYINRDVKSRGGSRGTSRNTDSRGTSRPTSSSHNPRAWSAASATNNTNNKNNTKNADTTSFKLRPLTAPKTEKTVMFYDDINDESSVISGNIMNIEVGYRRPTTATNTIINTGDLVLVGSQHIRNIQK